MGEEPKKLGELANAGTTPVPTSAASSQLLEGSRVKPGTQVFLSLPNVEKVVALAKVVQLLVQEVSR